MEEADQNSGGVADESLEQELRDSDEAYLAAEDRVDRWLKGRLEGQAAEAKRLCPIIEQLCRDLNEAHNEILRLQDVPESEFGKYDWPEWTPQANSIRWAERELKQKLAKTDHWTLYPERTRAGSGDRSS